MTTMESQMEQSTSQPESWYRRVTTKVYIAHGFTTWGDRMWSFAISLFLVKMSSGFTLRLAGIYGLVLSCSVIVFGGLVGKWVDKKPRMTVAWKSLALQNSLVVICSVVLMGTLFNLEKLKDPELWWLLTLLQAVIITLGTVANLASVASNISISQDWIVVIARRNKTKLANINAWCRRIDLSTKLLAPFIVGLIMNRLSDVIAAIFIASWNVFSMLVEFLLRLSIYKQVPQLATKSSTVIEPIVPKENEEVTQNVRATTAPLAEEESSITEEIPAEFRNEENVNNLAEKKEMKKPRSWFERNVIGYFRLWANYFLHPIFPAGFGLACLYMTVLAFDAITIGFAFSQGVDEYILGLLGGAGAFTGLIGTIVYPPLRKKIGIERTGLFGFFIEVSCLTLCVVSVWAPGSPFDPKSIFLITASDPIGNLTANITSLPPHPPQNDYTSIILLMTGITAARAGLWMSDLTITQIIQEEVDQRQRGAINGIQNSLNNIMDLVKYILVIILPYPQQFGYLVLASFTVICIGWFSYAIYSRRIRHHILPFHRYFNGNTNQPIPPLRNKSLEKF